MYERAHKVIIAPRRAKVTASIIQRSNVSAAVFLNVR
jgi:hypothetical protein